MAAIDRLCIEKIAKRDGVGCATILPLNLTPEGWLNCQYRINGRKKRLRFKYCDSSQVNDQISEYCKQKEREQKDMNMLAELFPV